MMLCAVPVFPVAEAHPELVLPEGLIVKRAGVSASRLFRVGHDLQMDHSGQYAAFGRFDTPEPMPSPTFIAAVVALAGTMTPIAQQKPDFSGEWQLNREASILSPNVAPAVKSGALRIEHHEPSFKCQMTIVMDKPFETKYELLTDGREVAATERGRKIVSSLRWDSDALVATWRIEGSTGEMTISFVMNSRPTGAAFAPRNSSAVAAAIRTMCGYSSGLERMCLFLRL